MSVALRINLDIPTESLAEFISGLSEIEAAELRRRMRSVADWRAMISEFERMRHPQPASSATRAYLNAHPDISKSSLYRWSKAVDAQDYSALVDGRKSNGGDGGGRNATTVSPDAWTRFKHLYLTIQRRSVKSCWIVVQAEAADVGWSWPKLRTIQLKVEKELPPFEADYYRLGEKEWRRLYEPKIRRDYSQFRSNQYWVADFHECDVFCRKDDSPNADIVRPLLSGWIDLRSRLVVGFRIVNRECQDSVLLAFRDGVEKYGPPQHVIIDNGKPYRAIGVSGGRPTTVRMVDDEDYARSVFGALSVEVHFSIPFNPDSKLIERWFNTLESQFGSTFLTYCGGDKDDRFRAAWKIANDHPEKCPTVAEFSEKLREYIDDVYNATIHTGDGMDGLSPVEAFSRFDPIPRAVVPDGLMDILCMRPTRPVKVGRFGVVYNKIEYGQSDPRLLRMQGSEVVLRVHPEDASYVLICELDGKPLFKAFNNKLQLTGVTQDDLAAGMKAKSAAKRLARQVLDGKTRPLTQSVTDAAIAARRKAADSNAMMDRLMKATGTDDASPRSITPLRSDWASAMERMTNDVRPPQSETPARKMSLEDFV